MTWLFAVPIVPLPNGTTSITFWTVSRDRQRNLEPAGGAEALRAKLVRAIAEADAARAAVDALQRKLAAITDHRAYSDASVADRIRAFFRQNSTMSFSPVEIADAVGAPVETVRKTLQRMIGEVEHAGYGAYKLNGWEQDRLNRNWHD